MEFNDGSQYRVVSDPGAQLARREVYCHRAASAKVGEKYVDTTFADHRQKLQGMKALLYYQFVWQNAGTPEEQANFFCDAIGRLADHEMVMLDIEVGGAIGDPADFTRRWLAVTEQRLATRAWIYIPRALSKALEPLVDGRIVMAPRYSGSATRGVAPDWPHDVHQYTDVGDFPGCKQSGDVSYTELTVQQMLERCRPKETNVPTSYNGWSAEPGWTVKGGQLQSLVVAGEPFSPGVRKGDVHTVLEYVAQQLHNRVEPVVRADWHQADDWGYSYRANANNPNQLSCHASGTAIDYNATRHPNGKTGTWTAAQKAEIKKILAEVNNVVRNLSNDEMHFEIIGTAAQVAAAAKKVRGGTVEPSDPLEEIMGWYKDRADFETSVRNRILHTSVDAGGKLDVPGQPWFSTRIAGGDAAANAAAALARDAIARAAGLTAAVEALSRLLAEQDNGLTYEGIKEAIREVAASGIDVELTVQKKEAGEV